jgi:hypothetical protein
VLGSRQVKAAAKTGFMRVVSAMSYTTGHRRLSDGYLIWLLGVLLGYATVGKGFAYIGVGHLYIGDMTLLFGIVVLLSTRCLGAASAMPASIVLALTMAWVSIRTLPYINEYAFDALRDSVVVMYGAFAFILCALLLEDSRRLSIILHYYRKFIRFYVPVALVVFLVKQYMGDYIPRYPSAVPILQVRPGEIAVHLVGAAAFALVGFCRVSRAWIFLLLVSLAIVGGMHRGSLVAEVVPIAAAALILGRVRESVMVAAATLMIFAAAYGLEVTFTENSISQLRAERQLSAVQMVANIESIFDDSADQALEGTKTWRLDWWNTIMNDTVYGPHFWTGRGFGINLANADGFQDRTDPNSPLLRSPHNVNMTMLARAGVPGLVLWVLFLACWLGMMAKALRTALRNKQADWAGLFLFVSCYAASIFIDASFDVALEGPMLGIWFWCLIGFGTAATMICRSSMRAGS